MNIIKKKQEINLFLMFAFICFFILNFCQNSVFAADNTATINNLRISVSDNKVRIVADADKEVDYQSFALSSPNRIVVDLSDAKLAKNVSREINVDSNYVKKVRIGQFEKNTVRIVVESNVNRDKYDVFGITGQSSYRVAMDFGNISYGGSSSGDSYIADNTSNNDNNDTYKPSDISINSGDKNSLKGKRITIDPGHGGSDSGAIGPSGLYEKTATLKIGLNLAEMLKQAGAKVYITRKTDVDVAPQPASDVEELQARCDVGNMSNSDIFVSIHLDSFTSEAAQGTTGYYYVNGSVASQRLADDIKEGVINKIGTADRGTKTSNFYVVKHTDMPATLLEVAFISNPDEESILKSDDGQKNIAEGIFNGIVNYFSN